MFESQPEVLHGVGEHLPIGSPNEAVTRFQRRKKVLQITKSSAIVTLRRKVLFIIYNLLFGKRSLSVLVAFLIPPSVELHASLTSVNSRLGCGSALSCRR